MKKWKLWTALLLSASMVLQPFGMAGNPDKSVKAAGTMVTDSQLSGRQVEGPDSWGALPNDEQLHYMKAGLAAFCHFGPNTFNNVEWGENYGTKEPSEIFHLKSGFDAEGLVKSVKDAGFSRLILTAKHHDGLCLWNSETTTTYNVVTAGYDGDILEELSDACTKYNLDMGCYLSPWDIHEDKYGCFGDNNHRANSKGYTDYNKLYIDQIKEICTAKKPNGEYKYGNNNPDRRSDRFVEWWMDGAQGSASNRQTFDWKGILTEIREHNPNCQVFGTHAAVNGINGEEDKALAATGGIHWIGNEEGKASNTTWAKLIRGKSYEDQTLYPRPEGAIEGKPDGDQWSVPEVDARILSGWFWTDGANENTLKSEERLAKMYFESVGRGATFLLNLSPNKTGAISEAQKNRFLELGENIRNTFDEDLAKAEGVTVSASSVWKNAKEFSPDNVVDTIPENKVYDETYWAPEEGETTGSIQINLGGIKRFDVVSIEEYIQKGQTISSFSVEYKDASGRWELFGEGKTVSAKRLCRRSPVEGSAVRINILSAYSTPMINNIGVFKATEGFETEEAGTSVRLPSNLALIPVADFVLDSSWTMENNNASAWSNAEKNGRASFTFTGTQAWIMGTKDPNHGTMDILIDGEKVGSANTYSATRAMGQLLYTTPELEYGSHTVEIVCTQNAIGLAGANYADGTGIFEMKISDGTLFYGDTMEVEIVRKAGSMGEAEISYITESSGAEQGVNYQHVQGSVKFAEGETSKKVTLKAYDKNGIPEHDDRIVDGKDFYFTLLASDTASIGVDSVMHIVLYNVNPKDILDECKNIDLDQYSKEGREAFETAVAELEAYINSGIASEQVLKTAAMAAFKAKNNLSAREGYTAEDPYELPVSYNQRKEIEAEKFILDASGVVNPEQYVRIAKKNDATVVDWFENGNKIRLPFYAANEGTYKVTATYLSGRTQESGNPNAFNWGGTNVESGSVDVYGEEGATTFHTVDFTVRVTAAGNGELVFAADSKGGPVIDKFVIQNTNADAKPVAVESVKLNKMEMKLTKDKNYDVLVATVLPVNAANKQVAFTSSNTAVAQVDSYGLVKGVANGNAVITATSVDGAKTAACSVTVDLGQAPVPTPPDHKEELPVVTALSAPAGVTAKSTVTGVKITFQASLNASSYDIYRKEGNKAARKIASVTNTSYVDEKAPAAKKLTYTVTAVSANASYTNSAQSAGAGVTLPKTVSGLKVKAVNNGVQISFKQVKGAKNYTILRARKKNGKYTKVKTLSAKKTAYVDKKAKKGKNFYKVVVKKGKLYSPASSVKQVTVKKK